MDDTGIFDIPNTSLIFWEIITFAILLLFLLYRYVYPPIREQILDRQTEIEGAIDEAQKTREEARELLAEYRRQIDEARGEARRILDEARKQGEAQRERTKREAREEGDRIIQRAREEIERERDGALRDVRREVADMVIQASERVSAAQIDRDEHERLISEALDSLEAEGAGSSAGTAVGPLERRLDLRRGPLRGRRERDELEAVLEELEEFVERPRRERGAAGSSSTAGRSPSARSAGP